MNDYVALVEQAIRTQHGLTAFSALPNAPVLPVVERRRPLLALRQRLASALAGGRGGRRATTAPAVARPVCS